MTAVLGINGVFHDSAAALVVDGEVVAAAEEERFTRRKHAKPAVAFSTWEIPENAARWCLEEAGLEPAELAAVGYSYDPSLTAGPDVTGDPWERLRTLFTSRAPNFLTAALPGLSPKQVRFVPHHLAHAASAYHAAGFPSSAVLVVDGRGERASHLAAHRTNGELKVLAAQSLPHSLGLLYEEVTERLGFKRSSDEYKVMAMAAFGEPTVIDYLRDKIHSDGRGGFRTEKVDWDLLAPPLRDPEQWQPEHADLACSVQTRLEEVLLELCQWLAERTGERRLVMAGGVALNCVANSRLLREGPFEEIWVQPAAGDAGTALGSATYVAEELGQELAPMSTAALGRGWEEPLLQEELTRAALPLTPSPNVATSAAEWLAADKVIGWYQGRSEWGPRALGHRSLFADPRKGANLERLNAIKGREQFRPVAPMVLESRAEEVFEGPIPSPYMLFTHRVRPEWIDRIPAAVHVDGTARIQTVDPEREPRLGELLTEFERLTGVPVLINTSFNTAGRPMVDQPRDAIECFASSPIDALAIGSFLIERSDFLNGSRQGSQPQAPTA